MWASVCPGVSRQRKLDGAPDLMISPPRRRAIDAADARGAGRMGHDPGAGGRDHAGVAGRVVEVLVRVQDLRDRPAALPRARQHGGGVERVDRQRLARIRQATRYW